MPDFVVLRRLLVFDVCRFAYCHNHDARLRANVHHAHAP